jgi:hypothetical protein
MTPEIIEQWCLETVVQEWHHETRTYIQYVPWMGSRKAKGFGNFPCETYENFTAKVAELVRPACKENLKYWAEEYREWKSRNP